MVRDAAYANLAGGAPFAAWLLKFFPIAFIVAWDSPKKLDALCNPIAVVCAPPRQKGTAASAAEFPVFAGAHHRVGVGRLAA